ncbi:uncharacterized protein LOC141641153 [Silene latifolia]|uniref:uncharacterized protein LOC141641153 n=1 Tax=Silene latifolia TaxID=37657 RepID=UPI003D76BF43
MGFKFHPLVKSLSLSHLMFADDLLLFCKGNAPSIKTIIRTFSTFSATSGLKMSKGKSNVYFNGVNEVLRSDFLHVSGLVQGRVPFRYLGVPIKTTRLSAQDYKPLIDKIGGKERVRLLCAVDVIDRLKKPGKLEEIVLKSVIDIELNSGDALNITLWSHVAKIFGDHLNSDTTKTNVVAHKLKNMSTAGNITMGPTDQTRIYEDINLPQKKEYIEGIDTANSNFELDTYYASEDIENIRTLTIKELTELTYASNVADGTKVICKSTITRINTTKPWYFTSCLSCRKKLIYEDGEKICRFCKKPADIPITRYRVEFEVEDHTGNNTFVLLDRLAESLIQVPVTTLLSDNSEDENWSEKPMSLKLSLTSTT